VSIFRDDDKVTLITTVQQILTGLRTADTEEDRFTVIMRAVYGLVMQKYGSQSALSNRSAPLAPPSMSDPPSSQTGGDSTNHQEFSHRCKLNLVINPHRTRCLGLTVRQRESAAMQPMPEPRTFTLKIKAIRSSETLVSSHHMTRHNNPENHEF